MVSMVECSSIMDRKIIDINQKEKELIISAKSSDKAAYEELVALYSGQLYSYLFRMSGNHQDAEDILQEALCSAYSHIHQFNGKSQFSTWLYRIAINICCRSLRQRRLRCFQDKFNAGIGRDPVLDIPEPRPDAASGAIENEIKQKVRIAIADLPKSMAEIITLKELEGFNYDEIAERLGIPQGTVMSRLYRARLKLSKVLKKEGLNG